MTQKTPPNLPNKNSAGDRSVTSSRSSDRPSRSVVIEVTASALMIDQADDEQQHRGLSNGRQHATHVLDVLVSGLHCTDPDRATHRQAQTADR